MKRSKRSSERRSQLAEARRVLNQLQAELNIVEKKDDQRYNLADHLAGFYEEIDKLAKGRTLVEATSLVVDQVNDIIRDAKEVVENDIYLGRIKEFVPAGNNPVYPDVLLVARTVRQSLERCEGELDGKRKAIASTQTRARTVIAALECFLSGEEGCELGSREDVERYVVGDLDASCFYDEEDSGQDYFDFDALDSQSVEQFIRTTESDRGNEEEADVTDVEEEEQQEEAEE